MRGVYIAPSDVWPRPPERPGRVEVMTRGMHGGELGRRLKGGSQPPASRVSASRSTRPPAESPVWASSPTSSTIEAASSLPLGGCTGRPSSIVSSDSKPWRGTGGSAGLGADTGFGGRPGRGPSASLGLCRGSLGPRGGTLPRGGSARAGALGAGAGQARQHARLFGRAGRGLLCAGRGLLCAGRGLLCAGRGLPCAGSPAPAGWFLFAWGAHRSAQSSRIGVGHTGWARAGVKMGHVRL